MWRATTENRLEQLERELAETREYLRNLTEDHEAHVEELRAAQRGGAELE